MPDSSAHISSTVASTRCSGSWMRPRAASRRPRREHGPAHQPRRPDVAEHAALVAEPVGQPGLAEQLVELAAMLLGDLAADARRSAPRRRTSSASPPADRDADRAQQHVGQLERARPADVEAVEQPVADEVEVAGDGRAGLAVERAQRVEHRGRVAVGLEQLPAPRGRSRSRRSAARARPTLRRRPARCRASGRAARRAEGRSSRRRARGSRRSAPPPRPCSACAGRSSPRGGRGSGVR